jgi:hypothetical protein
MHTNKFNVLDWCKVARTRYLALRRITRDFYVIPFTTIVSESAFWTSGRVLSKTATGSHQRCWGF